MVEPLPPLRIRGMHGLGDNLHQRGIIRQLMEQYNVYLESSWVSIYHDLISKGLKVIHKPTELRSQTKNAEREADLFYKGSIPHPHLWTVVRYQGEKVRELGSVLGAMCHFLGSGPAHEVHVNPELADFRLPIPNPWKVEALELIESWNTAKPIMIYRPLCIRQEYLGLSTNRNPDVDHYYDLFQSIRDKFYVVSVADLKDGEEWVCSKPIDADQEYHNGEIHFELLAALVHCSALVYGSPGFVIPLAQAVSTPNVCVFGGFETSTSFTPGARYTPTLAVGPIEQCGCWSQEHDCPKKIDMPLALSQLEQFVSEHVQ